MKLVRSYLFDDRDKYVVLRVTPREWIGLHTRWIVSHASFRALDEAERQLLEYEIEVAVNVGRQFERPGAHADDAQMTTEESIETLVRWHHLTQAECDAIGLSTWEVRE